MMEMHKFKKKYFFNKYKMIKTSAKIFAENCIQNIIDKKILWLRIKDIGEKLGVENIYDLLIKKLKADLRLEIQQINKLENKKDMGGITVMKVL